MYSAIAVVKACAVCIYVVCVCVCVCVCARARASVLEWVGLVLHIPYTPGYLN